MLPHVGPRNTFYFPQTVSWGLANGDMKNKAYRLQEGTKFIEEQLPDAWA